MEVESYRDQDDRDLVAPFKPPKAFNSFSVTDKKLVGRIGTKNFFKLMDSSASNELNEKFKDLKKAGEQQISELLLECEHLKGFQDLIEILVLVSMMSDEDGAERLVSINASESFDEAADVATYAFLNNKDLFYVAAKQKTLDQPVKKRSYRIYINSKNWVVPASLDPQRVSGFIDSLKSLYKKRKWSGYCDSILISNENFMGLIVDHGSSKAGFSVVDDFQNSLVSLLRMTRADIFIVERSTGSLWLSPQSRSSEFFSEVRGLFGLMLFGDSEAYKSPLKMELSSVLTNSDIEQVLRSPRSESTAHVELRKLTVAFGPTKRKLLIIPGPAGRGCITEDPGWRSDVAPDAELRSMEIVVQQFRGDHREHIDVSETSIKMACSSSIGDVISALQDLRIVPRNEN